MDVAHIWGILGCGTGVDSVLLIARTHALLPFWVCHVELPGLQAAGARAMPIRGLDEEDLCKAD